MDIFKDFPLKWSKNKIAAWYACKLAEEASVDKDNELDVNIFAGVVRHVLLDLESRHGINKEKALKEVQKMIKFNTKKE